MALGNRTFSDDLKTAFLKRRTQNQGLDADSKKARSSGLFGRRLQNTPSNKKPPSPMRPIRSIPRF